MGRETKVGLGVLVVLSALFVVVVAKRWRPPVRVIPTVESSVAPASVPRVRPATGRPLVLEARSHAENAAKLPATFEAPAAPEPEPSRSYLPQPSRPGRDPRPFAPASPGTVAAIAPSTGPNLEPTPSPAAIGVDQHDDTYTVVPGDSFYRIAHRVYGDARWFLALAAHNRQRIPNPDRLAVGAQVDIVRREQLRDLYPALCPDDRLAADPSAPSSMLPDSARRAGERPYQVRGGDTLSAIALRELGDAGRWTEIYELNRDRIGEDVDFLRLGLQLILPAPGHGPAENRRVTRGRDAPQR